MKELRINWHGAAKLDGSYIPLAVAYRLIDTAQVTQTDTEQSWSVYRFQRPTREAYEDLMLSTRCQVSRRLADANAPGYSVWVRDAARDAVAELALHAPRLMTQHETFVELFD